MNLPKIHLYIFLIIGLTVLNSCSSDINKTDPPIETPGVIEKLAPEILTNEFEVADWRFDSDRILLVKGIEPPRAIPYDLLWFDPNSHKLTPLNIPENGSRIYCVAQGKNGQVVYNRDVLYLYDSHTGQKTLLGEGCYPSFSPDGTKVAFIAKKEGLKIYNIAEGKMEQTISLLPFGEEAGEMEVRETNWRVDGRAVDLIYSWRDPKSNKVYRSQIREIGLKEQKQGVIYQGTNIMGFSWSPDGRLFVVAEYDYAQYKTILKFIQILDQREITQLAFPDDAYFVRWSPAGDKIMLDFIGGGNTLVIQTQKVLENLYTEKSDKTH